jgi:hypothetical protein
MWTFATAYMMHLGLFTVGLTLARMLSGAALPSKPHRMPSTRSPADGHLAGISRHTRQ